MSKMNVKRMHALVDELAATGDEETMTALGTIMMALAQSSAEDGDLELDDGDGKEKTSSRRAKRGKTGRRSKASDDEGDDEGEDADDTDLDGLDGLDVDDEDDEPKRDRRGKAKAEAEDEAEEVELPELGSVKNFDKFLDAVDELDGDAIEIEEGGMRELAAELAEVYDVDVNFTDVGVDDDLVGKELRDNKKQAYGLFLAKMNYIRDQLVELGEDGMAKIAKVKDVDLDEVKGRGKALLKNQAQAIVASLYGGEDE